MSNHKSLVWFNKEGDYMNFSYNEPVERFEGNVIFHENSSDTFKTIGLYMFEKIPAFDYEIPGDLQLDKYQLFNEYGFNLYGSNYATQSVTKIEPTNPDPSFYSKWIYGNDFETKYPVGSQIKFDQNIFEFGNQNECYTVVGTKKGAIMIISNIDNTTFETNWSASYSATSSFQNITITGVNAIGIYDYIESVTFANLISFWSEPLFYDKFYNGKKLSLINTTYNDKIVSIENENSYDKIYNQYRTKGTTVSSDDLVIELLLYTDLPKVYTGGLVFNATASLIGFSSTIPTYLKPGVEFKIPSAILNTNYYTVASIAPFDAPNYYATASQVIFNNKIFQCIQGYTQSVGLTVSPLDTSYWSAPTFLPINETLLTEVLLNTDVYLTSNHLYFTHNATVSIAGTSSATSSTVYTLAGAADKFKSDFQTFNIDLYYDSSTSELVSKLHYPSKYAEIKYLFGTTMSNHTIPSLHYEKFTAVNEQLVTELNKNISENFNYDIIFTDIDEFGIIVRINGMVYDMDIEWIYVGLNVDMPRTIDKTLRNWYIAYFARLVSLGIIADLTYVGAVPSIYYNTINLKTEYPNVPFNFNIEVGTTADFNIPHSKVIFYDMGNFVSIVVNNRTYTKLFNSTIAQTLADWVGEYSDELRDFKIYVTNINNTLKFDTKSIHQDINLDIKLGKSFLPGQKSVAIIKQFQGNYGSLISSNEVIIGPTSSSYGTVSLEEAGFATGMLVSIQNTVHQVQNQQYNITYLDPSRFSLSYQGPFWGTTNEACLTSPFFTLAFNLGFGQTGCPLIPVISGTAGPYLVGAFSTSSFSINYISLNNYNTYTYTGQADMVDIAYVNLSQSIFALGDNITVIDANNASQIAIIGLGGNTQSVALGFNPINNYLYALTKTQLFCIDPILNSVITTISLPAGRIAYDLSVNQLNGDIWVSYSNYQGLNYWNSANVIGSVVQTVGFGNGNTFKLQFNSYDNDIYVTTDTNYLLQIDGSTRAIQTSFLFTDLKHQLYFDDFGNYVYGFDTNVFKIIAGSVSTLSIAASASNSIVVNPYTTNLYYSNNTSTYYSFDQTGSLNYTTLMGNWGPLEVNQYDTDIYLACQGTNNVLIIDPVVGQIKQTILVPDVMTKMIYNPKRRSMWGIMPATDQISEVVVTLGSSMILLPGNYATANAGNMYGTLDPNYVQKANFWLKTREYLRKPRENFEGETQVKYKWKWVDDTKPDMFIYDFSGTQLQITGSYAYTGIKPLSKISLIDTPNRDFTKVDIPEFQQTVFDEITYDLDYIDSSENVSFMPVPLELFIGYNSPDEGVYQSTLQLMKVEDVVVDITSDSISNNTLTFTASFDEDRGRTYSYIYLDINSLDVFTGRGLKQGQRIKINIRDITNSKKQFISFNNGKTFIIDQLYTRILALSPLDGDNLVYEETIINDYPSLGKITYLKTSILVTDMEIARFNVIGQTEIEDVRYDIELTNVGKNVTSQDVFIFKEYDINEQGVDWAYLNRKRKEMLMTRHDIFPYVGSYKAIINAINFFGYNDLELYEYYKNINKASANNGKLFKVEIPDIFDNTVEGWTPKDFLSQTLPNPNFDGTNLFNLTYHITDKEGNYILLYSIDEVVIKLLGLKRWLQRNVIPISHKILDITGRTDFVGEKSIVHRNSDINIFNIRQNMVPIDFDINEAYVMPVNSGSSVFNVAIDFKSATMSETPDYFNVHIRTYQTYKEWLPFDNYIFGSRVQYFEKLYESATGSAAIPNRTLNPRKYENIEVWRPDRAYLLGQLVNYNSYIYEYGLTASATFSATSSGTASYLTGVPYTAITEWFDITEWREISLNPVQTFNEYRLNNDLTQYHFTVDTLIDPYVVVEVTSDNGYGQIYTSKKNYELRPPNNLIVENIDITQTAPTVVITNQNVSFSSAFSPSFS